MENENQIYVRYGDYIMLQIEHLQGTVQSSSFLNRNVYLQLHPNHFQELISRNKKDFIFQVLPKFAYDAQIDYQQALEFFNKNYNENQEVEENKDNEEKKEGKGDGEQKEEQEGQGEEQAEDEIMNVSVSSLLGIGPKKKKGKPLNFAQKKERDNYKKKLLQLQRKLKEEEIQNLKTQNNRRGEFVEYGNEIMLLHVDSNCFLEASKAAADEDNSCNKVELNQYGSKLVYWKTVGGFRYKQPGDRIHYNDQIVLQHIMTNAFLHVTEKCIKVEGLEGQVPEDIKLGQSLVTPKKIDRREPPTSFAPLCEVNVSTIKSKFSIIIYRYFDEDPFDQFVKGGSVIRMLHSEKGGYLHSDDKDFTDDGLAEVYIWNFKGKSNDIESTSSSSLFEIQLCCKNQKFTDEPKLHLDSQANAQEKPKMNSNDRSGKVFEYSLTNAQAADSLRKQNPFEAQYRLRHLNTGRLVIDQEVEIQGIKMRTLGLGPHVIMKSLANFSEKLIEKVPSEMKEIETLDGYIIEDMQTDMSPQTMEELDQRSRFRIISTNPSMDPRICQFSCVQMQHVASDMYLAYETKSMFAGVAEARKEDQAQSGEEMMRAIMEEEENNKKKQKTGKDDEGSQNNEEILYFPVNDDDIQSGTRDACELKAMRSNEDAFFVIPEKQSVLQDILFVQTSIDLLKKYLPIICSRSLEISKEKQVRIFVMLETIYNFLMGDTSVSNDDNQDLPTGFSKNENDLIQSRKENQQLRQKLMRELYAVEHLVQIIYLPFSHGDFILKQVKGHDLIAKVIRKVYTLVRLIGQQYYQNELYVSQWINIFFNHAMATNSSNNIGADDAILVLVDENKKLLDIQINKEIIERFIVLCKAQNRNKKIIQLLTAICAVAGEPIKKNQDDITAKLLEDESNRAVLMMPLRMRNDQSVDVLVDNSEPGGCWKSLNNYRTFSRATYGYFLSIVDLASELCVGRNNRSLKSLQDMYSFDTIRNIVKNNDLPPEMRAIFMRILLNMHMDREPLEAIQIPSLTGIWSDLPPFIQEKFNDPTNLVYNVKQAKISVPQSLTSIKNYVEQCLYDTEGIMNIFEVGKNIMILETLKIVKFMLNHGFYIDLKELKEISIPMIKILNGSTDIYYNQLENNGEIDEYLLVKRYFCTAEDLIIQCKIIICENLLTISMLETDGKAQVFMSKFKADIDLLLLRRKINVQVSTNVQKKQAVEEEQVFELPKQGIFSCFKNLGKGEAEEDEKNASKQEDNKNSQFMDLITSFHNFEAENQDSYICVLFDLLLYREPQLASKAFQLLYRLFCRKRILLENLMGIQMLENHRSIQVLSQIKLYHTELKGFIDDVEQWLNKNNHRSKKIKYRVTEIFEFFSSICSEKKKNQNEIKQEDQIQKQEFSAIEMENQDSVLEIPNENTSKVNISKINVKNADQKVNKQDFILFNNQDQITNKENQRLLSSYQIDTMAMFFIKFRVDRNIVNDPFYNNLIHQCYKFLVLYVKDNFANQIKVHSNLEIFLRDIDKNPLICLLLYEMFRDNKRFLTLNVTKILRQIISSAEEAPLSSSKKALYMKLLEVFCKFEDKLVRPNQQEIVINFTRDIAKNNLIFLFTVEGLPHLQKMLKQCIPDAKPKKMFKALIKPNQLNASMKNEAETEQRAKVTMEIFNIIVCLNLMSMCCEGKSDVAENRCQTEILNMPTALHLYKLGGRLWPFKCSIIRYVAQVFLDSNNVNLFQAKENSQNLNSLVEMIELLREDMANIHQSWKENIDDMPLDMPDESVTTLNKESQNFALNFGVTFLKALLKNKRIDLGEELYGTLHDITSNVAKMYYQSNDEDQRINALDVLIFINSSEKLAHLLENVQHPANQNIYLENKKAGIHRRICGVETENGQKTTALSAKLMQLAFSPNMVHQKEKEFENLCLWVTNINLRISSITSIKNKYEEDEQFSEKSFQNVSYKAILASFMSLLDSQSLSKDLHISGLCLLRKCVEAYNPGTTKPAADWQTEDWLDYQKIIEAKQNLLVEVGCVEFSCKHIQEVDDEDILEETFLVCMTLLLGGNRNAQDSFYKFFYFQDPTNLIMLKFKKLFIEYFDLTKKVLGEKNAKLVMMFRQQQRKDQKESQLKALAEQDQGQLDDDAIFAIKGYTLEEVVAEAEDVKQEEEEEEEDEDEQLLTVDESMEEGAGGGKNNGADSLDEMFMVRQTKTQTVIKCIRMLRFMQLLCEGQHLNLQNFLREQVFHSGASTQKSFNFITYVAQMLALYEKQYINCFSCSFGDQLISTLIETVQGPCKKNQMTLVEAKLIDCCRDLVQQGVSSPGELMMKGFSTPEKLKFHDQLISYAIKLLLSIIEGPVNTEIYKALANSFDDFVILTKRMEIIYERFVTQDLGLDIENVSLLDIKANLVRDSFMGGIVEGFDIYSLINQLSILLPDVEDKISLFTEGPSYSFFKNNTGNVEIQKDGEIMTIYFPIQPVTTFLTDGTKAKFQREVERESNQHKIIDLIAHIPQFIDELEHLYEQSHHKIQITPARFNALKDLSTFLSICMALVIIFFYRYDRVERADGTSDLVATIDTLPDQIITNLGYVQLATSIFIFVGFVLNRYNIIVRSGWRALNEVNRELMKSDVKYVLHPLKPPYGEFRAQELPVDACRILLLTEGPYHPAFIDNDGQVNLVYYSLDLEQKWICFCFLLQDFDMIFLMLYLCFSVQGIIQSRVFYSFHLLDCVNRFPQLQTVIQSVTVNGNQLMMTALLGVVGIYIFSAIGFIFVSDTYYRDAIDQGLLDIQGDSICQSMLHCFLSTLLYGLRGGGGIADYLPTESYAPKNRSLFFFRALYDLCFYISIITVLLNIIFGIIIDTFAQLRDKKTEMEEDMKNVCFICNIERQIFERDTEEGFEFHCLMDHDIWQYLNFIIHLKSINQTDLNGTESNILNLFEHDDISWFPMQKSQRLIMVKQRREALRQAQSRDGDGDENQIDDPIAAIKQYSENLEDKLKQISKKMNQ